MYKIFFLGALGTARRTTSSVSQRDLISILTRRSFEEDQIPPRSDRFRYGVAMLRGARNLPEFKARCLGQNLKEKEKYLEEAVTHYIKPAAERMHSEAENLYAICLHFGIGVRLTAERRLICKQIFFSRASLHGSVCGCYNYARFLIQSNVGRDPWKGVKILEGLTTLHHHDSPIEKLIQRQFLRGTPLSKDQYRYISEVSKQWEVSNQWDLGAMIMLGRHLFSQGNDKDAMFWFKLASSRGHPTGCFLYACMLLNSEQRETEAHYYYDIAAKKERFYAFLYAKLLCDRKTTRVTPEGAKDEAEIQETHIKGTKGAESNIEEMRKEVRKAREVLEEAIELVKAVERDGNPRRADEPINERTEKAKLDIERAKERIKTVKRDIREIGTEDVRQKVVKAMENCKREAKTDDKLPEMAKENVQRKSEPVIEEARMLLNGIAEKFKTEIREVIARLEAITKGDMQKRAQEIIKQASAILDERAEKFQAGIAEVMDILMKMTREDMRERAEEMINRAKETLQKIAEKNTIEEFEEEIGNVIETLGEVAKEDMAERAEEIRKAEEDLKNGEENIRKAEEGINEAKKDLRRGEEDVRKAEEWIKQAKANIERATRIRDRMAMNAARYYLIAAEGILIERKSTEMSGWYFDLPS